MKLRMITKAQEHNAAQVPTPLHPHPKGLLSWPRYVEVIPCILSLPLLWSSLPPSLCLLHSIYPPLPSPLFSLHLWLAPVAVPLRAAYQTHQRDFLAVAGCSSLSVYAHVCVSAVRSMHPYLPALIYGACYSLCYLLVGSYSPEDKIHRSLSNTGVRTRKSQRAQYPVWILVVPAYAQGAVAVSSLVMPVGCFSVFPLCLRLMLHVSISLAVVAYAAVPNFCLCLFPPSLVPPVRTHVLGTERQWGNSTSL